MKVINLYELIARLGHMVYFEKWWCMTDNAENREAPLGMTFPCELPIKIIGDNNEEFEKEILEILNRFYTDVSAAHFQYKNSKNDTYCSISYLVQAESREQVDQIYRELSASRFVRWVL